MESNSTRSAWSQGGEKEGVRSVQNSQVSVEDVEKGRVKVMALLILVQLKPEWKKELAITVLPPFRRRHLATDLIRVTWILFGENGFEGKETWVYVMNSNKSGALWRRIKQWFPSIRFQVVRP